MPLLILKAEATWDLLSRLNVSQGELARRSGIVAGYLSQLITGQRCPSPDVRERLLAALGVRQFDDPFVIVKAEGGHTGQ